MEHPDDISADKGNSHHHSRADSHHDRRTRHKALAEAAKKLIILGIALGALLAASGRIVAFFTIDQQYARYIQIAAIIIVGYFAVSVLSTAAYKIASRQSEQTAKTLRSFNRILGAIIIIAIVISYLSQDPVVAISLSTITGIVVGFAAQNLIGNLMAGMYLVIARPFRVGDRVNAFNQWGTLSSVDLLYCKIIMDNGDVMLAPNTGMVTTNVIVHRDSVPS